MSHYDAPIACRFHPNADLVSDYRAGDLICPECGRVVGDRMIDVGSEWRTFSDDNGSKDMCRVGGPKNPLFDNDTLETFMSAGIGPAAVDEPGKQKYKKGSPQISPVDRALRSGFDCVRQMARRIDLPERVIKRACILYKQCYESKCVRGRSQDGTVATCIFIACRQEGAQHSLKEICGISAGTSLKEIGRIFKQIKISLPSSTRCDVLDSKDLVPRFCNRLELQRKIVVQKAAIHIAERAKELCNIDSRAPDSVAGAAIYMACAAAGEKTSLQDIQVVTGVTQNTIRGIYRIMLPRAAELFAADFDSKCRLNNLPSS